MVSASKGSLDAETALRNLAHALLVDPGAPLVTVDEFATIRHCTPGVEQLTGHRCEDIVGSSIFDFIDEEEADEAANLFVRRLGYAGRDLGRQGQQPGSRSDRALRIAFARRRKRTDSATRRSTLQR